LQRRGFSFKKVGALRVKSRVEIQIVYYVLGDEEEDEKEEKINDQGEQKTKL